MPLPITKRQKEVLDFIKIYIDENSYSPTLEEIKKALRLSAVSTVHQHLDALINKGYINKFDNLARAIEINKIGEPISNLIEIPLLGLIRAGEPIEAIEIPETITVPKEFIRENGQYYGLKVEGDSMINDNIFDGDIVVIRNQPVLENGEIGVAILNDNEATLKRIYREKNHFKLQPANKSYQPIITKQLEVKGKVTGVIRNRFDLRPKPVQLPLFVSPRKSDQLLHINNRRFLGNKTKLLGFIGDIVADKCPNYYAFCDIFAGTGVVGNYFNRPDTKIISNDILESSYTSLLCWLDTKSYDQGRFANIIDHLNDLRTNRSNYVLANFGDTYFTKENAVKNWIDKK
jgi:repressor LexA